MSLHSKIAPRVDHCARADELRALLGPYTARACERPGRADPSPENGITVGVHSDCVAAFAWGPTKPWALSSSRDFRLASTLTAVCWGWLRGGWRVVVATSAAGEEH